MLKTLSREIIDWRTLWQRADIKNVQSILKLNNKKNNNLIFKWVKNPIRMAKSQNITTTKCWQGCGATGIPIHSWWEWRMVQLLCKIVWQLRKLNISYANPVIVCFVIDPKEMKSTFNSKICMCMLILALFINAKSWRKPRCPLVVEWINCSTFRQWNIIQD